LLIEYEEKCVRFCVEKVILPQNEPVVQVSCGQHFTICLTTNGKVVVWGSISGKTSNDDGLYYPKPEYLGGFSDKKMIQIAAGYSHCLALTDVIDNDEFRKVEFAFFCSKDGTVFAAGTNVHGQLGLGHNNDCVRATPVVCLRGSPIVFIACGAQHSLIVSKSG